MRLGTAKVAVKDEIKVALLVVLKAVLMAAEKVFLMADYSDSKAEQ